MTIEQILQSQLITKLVISISLKKINLLPKIFQVRLQHYLAVLRDICGNLSGCNPGMSRVWHNADVFRTAGSPHGRD